MLLVATICIAGCRHHYTVSEQQHKAHYWCQRTSKKQLRPSEFLNCTDNKGRIIGPSHTEDSKYVFSAKPIGAIMVSLGCRQKFLDLHCQTHPQAEIPPSQVFEAASSRVSGCTSIRGPEGAGITWHGSSISPLLSLELEAWRIPKSSGLQS